MKTWITVDSGLGERAEIVLRRLKLRRILFILDLVDIFLLSLVLCVAPPRAKERWQVARAFAAMTALSAIGAFLILIGTNWSAAIALGIAGLIVMIAAAFLRAAAVVDLAIDNKFAGLAGPEQPDVPDYGVTVAVVACFLLAGIPIGLLAMHALGWLSMLGPGSEIPWTSALLLTIDQLFRGALFYVFDHYNYGIRAPLPITAFDKEVFSGVRFIFSILLITAILRLASFRPRRRQMRAAVTALMQTPSFAIRLGHRMTPLLRRFIFSRPRSGYFREFIARQNAVFALAVIERDEALPLLRDALDNTVLRSGAVKGLMTMGSIAALRLLLVSRKAWDSVVTDERSDFWMGLGGFSQAVGTEADEKFIEELVAACGDESSPGEVRTGLMYLLALAACRYDVNPFRSEDIIEWQAREVGFGGGFPPRPIRPPHALLQAPVSRLLRGAFLKPKSDLDLFVALCGLDWLQSPDLASRFEELVRSTDGGFRARAMIALGRCGAHRGQDAIIGCYGSLTLDAERFIAAKALVEIGGDAAESFLFEMLTGDFPNGVRRTEAADAAGGHAAGTSNDLLNPLIEWLGQGSGISRRRLLNWSFGVEDDWVREFSVRICLDAEPELALSDGRPIFQEPRLGVIAEAVRAIARYPAIIEALESDLHSVLGDLQRKMKKAGEALAVSDDGDPPAYYELRDARATAHIFLEALEKQELSQSMRELVASLRETWSATGGRADDDDDMVDSPLMEMIGGRYVETHAGLAETIGADVNWKLLYLTGKKMLE